MAGEEIRNLDTLVKIVAQRVESQVKQGNSELLKELLWSVPASVLSKYAKD